MPPADADIPPGFHGQPAVAEDASAAPSITDYVDLESLQEIQDAFAVITRLRTIISDGSGRPLTRETDIVKRIESDRMLETLLEEGPAGNDGGMTAPIIVQHRQVGSLSVQRGQVSALDAIGSRQRRRLMDLLDKHGIQGTDRAELLGAAEEAYAPSPATAMQFLYLIANALARLGWQQHEVENRLHELSLLHRLATALTGRSKLDDILRLGVESIAGAMRAKGVNIRLLEGEPAELVSRASFGMTAEYANLGRSIINKSDLRGACLRGETVQVPDMQSDPRVYFKDDAVKMGFRSMLATGLTWRGRPRGMVSVFFGERRSFDKPQVHLLQSISQMLATAIENARLGDAQTRSQRLREHVKVAAEIQRKMMPQTMPRPRGLDLSAAFKPSLELSGDFYDALELPTGQVALTVADVAGKGVPAALTMATTRALVRSLAPRIGQPGTLVTTVNRMLTVEGGSDFATMFYGLYDPRTRILTYSAAGHEPPMVLRDGEVHMLEAGGLILGVSAESPYETGTWQFRSGDLLLAFTDGLLDAVNPAGQRLGRDAVRAHLLGCAGMNADEAVESFRELARRHRNGAHAADDMTLLVAHAE